VTCGIYCVWMDARIYSGPGGPVCALCVCGVLQRVGARAIIQVPCGAGALSIGLWQHPHRRTDASSLRPSLAQIARFVLCMCSCVVCGGGGVRVGAWPVPVRLCVLSVDTW